MQSSGKATPEPTRTVVSEETETGNSSYLINNLLVPSATEQCLNKVKVGESFEYDLSMNPYYLRGNFDGNKLVDYAILIVGKDSKKTALVICKDSTTPFVFGELIKSPTPLSDKENDNFIGSTWDVITLEEVNEKHSVSPDETNKKLVKAKGEVIVFYYEIDGVFYIYWDGNNFRSASEG